MSEDLDHWKHALEAQRRQKDWYFKNAPDSPIPAEARSGFSALQYFAPDPAYRIAVRLTPVTGAEPFTMAVSQGSPRAMIKKGYFDFEIDGKKYRLFAYGPAHDTSHDSLFVPFRDGTSGKETYGAGRYLDLEYNPGGEYLLDFNLAYNPYCAYSENYSCPLPPAENWLNVPIRAGERSFH